MNKVMKKIHLFFCIIVCALALSSCADADSLPSVEEEQMEESKEVRHYADITVGDTVYTYANFDEYNSSVEENGHGDEKHFILGKLGRINENGNSDEAVYASLTTEDNENWTVIFLNKDEVRLNTLYKFQMEPEIIVCGRYLGYTDYYKSPVISAENIYISDARYGIETWMLPEWIDTELGDTIEIGEMTYSDPSEWIVEDISEPEGKEYYPYGEAFWGFVCVNCIDWPHENSYDTLSEDYQSIYENLTDGANSISKEDLVVDDLVGEKIKYVYKIDNGQYEVIRNCVINDETLYMVSFVEYSELSPEMEAFSEDFMSYITFGVKNQDYYSKKQAKQKDAQENQPIESLTQEDIQVPISEPEATTQQFEITQENDISDTQTRVTERDTQSIEQPVASPVETGYYILNTNTHKFHKPTCGSANKIKASNRDEFYGSREDLIAAGYDPCGNCNP